MSAPEGGSQGARRILARTRPPKWAVPRRLRGAFSARSPIPLFYKGRKVGLQESSSLVETTSAVVVSTSAFARSNVKTNPRCPRGSLKQPPRSSARLIVCSFARSTSNHSPLLTQRGNVADAKRHVDNIGWGLPRCVIWHGKFRRVMELEMKQFYCSKGPIVTWAAPVSPRQG